MMDQTAMDETNGCVGYLFTLKKYMQLKDQKEKIEFPFMTFGYYNGLDINKVSKWYQFRPGGMESLGVKNSFDNLCFDQYTIKTVLPDQEQREQLGKKGFDFEVWGNLKQISGEHPFVSMVTIHLSEVFVAAMQDMKEMTAWLSNAILKIAQEKGIDKFETLHCGIFPSLGYPEFIAVFLTDTFSPVGKLIDGLRAQKHEGRAALSGCYTVCGMLRDCKKDMKEMFDEELSLSIKVSLKEGISAHQFLAEMLAELEDWWGKEGKELLIDCEELSKNVDYSITFGNSDCLIYPKKYLYGYLAQYKEGGIFNKKSNFYQNHIGDIRSTIEIKENLGIPNKGREYNKEQEEILLEAQKDKKADFKKFLDKLDAYIRSKNKPIRISRAIQRTMINYLNIAYSSHGFDVRNIFEPFFDAFIMNMSDVLDSSDLSECDEALKAATIFREYVGDYLLDLIRSDKPFIEGNSLMHPSIGSATKLLFAYNIILRDFANEVNAGKADQSFLVTSGGTDTMVSIDLFDFYDDAKNKPIIIVVPEMALYDMEGTLFRIFHECMHFCGDRKRKLRYDKFVQNIASFIADDLSRLLYYEERAKDMCPDLDLYCSDEIYSEVLRQIREEISILQKETRNEIYKRIQQMDDFRNYSDRYDKFYERDLFKENSSEPGILTSASLIEKLVKNVDFNKDLYDLFLDKEIHLAQKVSEIIEEAAVATKGKMIYFRHHFNLERISIYGENNEVFPMINDMLDIYWEYFFYEIETLEDSEFEIVPYAERIGILISVFQECFSDVCAAKVLNMGVAEFLLAFVYDKMELDQAMPKNITNALRMQVDLRFLYNITEGLPDAVEEEIKKEVENWRKKGFEYEGSEEYIARLDSLLKFGVGNGRDAYLVMESAMEYLDCCMQSMDKKIFGIGDLYSKSGFEPSLNELNYFMDKWKGMAHRREVNA